MRMELYEREFSKLCRANRIRLRLDGEEIPTAYRLFKKGRWGIFAQQTGTETIYFIGIGLPIDYKRIRSRNPWPESWRILSKDKSGDFRESFLRLGLKPYIGSNRYCFLAICASADFLEVAKRLGLVKKVIQANNLPGKKRVRENSPKTGVEGSEGG